MRQIWSGDKRNCAICNHERREEIEKEFIDNGNRKDIPGELRGRPAGPTVANLARFRAESDGKRKTKYSRGPE